MRASKTFSLLAIIAMAFSALSQLAKSHFTHEGKLLLPMIILITAVLLAQNVSPYEECPIGGICTSPSQCEPCCENTRVCWGDDCDTGRCMSGPGSYCNCIGAISECGADCETNSNCPADNWYCGGGGYPSGQRVYRDYSCSTSCMCTYSVTSTGINCDTAGNVCGDGWYWCDGTKRENRDYYCVGGTGAGTPCSYTVAGTQQCLTQCASAYSRYTSCTNPADCSVSYCSGSYDCRNDCASACARRSGCTAGSGCTGSADCGPYTCSAGSGCTTTCDQACGAACDADNDCPADACTGTCGTGTDSCMWRDNYCETSGTTPSCTCKYNNYDSDTLDTRCTGCGLNWAVGGSGDCSPAVGEPDCLATCCGDDSGEVYEACAIGFDIAWSSSCISSDDTCCDEISCVDPSLMTCYPIDSYYNVAGISSGSDQYARCAGGGGWRDCDESSGNCGGCAGVSGFPCTAGGSCWVYGGEGSGFGEYAAGNEQECCGDDSGENYDYCKYTGEVAWSASCTSSADACCNANDCIDTDGTCYTGWNPYDVAASGNDNLAYCGAGSDPDVWTDCDLSETRCDGTNDCASLISGCTNCWTQTGESVAHGEYSGGQATSECCGDDSGENYVYFMSYGGAGCNDITDERCVFGGDDTADNACCYSDTAGGLYDCVYGGNCYDEGRFEDLDGDGRIDGWCMTSDTYKNTWRDCDDLQGSCDGSCNANYVQGGESSPFGEYDTGTSTECCGDDSGEEYITRICQSGSGWSVCPTDPNDNACCNADNKCVWNNVCYADGAGHPSITGAECDNGMWIDTAPPTTTIGLSGTLGWDNWYRTDVDVTLSCSDTGGSGCANRYYCTDATNTCSPSTLYSSAFTFSSEGTSYVRYYSTDNAGNAESVQSTQVKIDKTNPVLVSYSVSGCDYTDIPNQICFVNPGTVTTHEIRHTDSISTPYRQYITFTNGCTPNLCGCNWGEACASGDEIKSWVQVDTGAFTDSMWNDIYLDIQSVSCTGTCTGTDVTELWSVQSGNNPKDYDVYAFLYDESGRGVGYTDTGWDLRMSSGGPIAVVIINNNDAYTGSTSVTLSLTYTDTSGSGIMDCRYRNAGGIWTDWEACAPTKSWTLTSGDGLKNVEYEVRDNLLNTGQDTDTITLDTTPPSTNASLSGTLGDDGWYTTDVDADLVCDDGSGSGCDTTYYCVDTANTCSPSTLYSSTLAFSSEGTSYVRYYSTDNAGNSESVKSAEVKIDKTDPVFVSYSVSGCDYEDETGQICWVKPGTTTYHEMEYTDAVSTPYQQFIVFARNNCEPNFCGCNWGEACASGDEIKSSYYTDTGTWYDHMWNDSVLNLTNPTCTQVPDCLGDTAKINWEAITGSSVLNHSVWTFLYDEAGNRLVPPSGYVETNWWLRSDITPPVSSVSPLPPYIASDFILSWSGSDSGSGVDCYTIQYEYNDTQTLSGWQDFIVCTNQTSANFNAFQAAGNPPGGVNNYVFYFRSLAKDRMDNWESKTGYDTEAIIFTPELTDVHVEDEFGNPIPNEGKTAASRRALIHVQNRTEDPLNITINYSAHAPRNEPGIWNAAVCSFDSACVGTAGPYTEDRKVDFYVYAVKAYTGEPERNPPVGYYSFNMHEHPLANFAANLLMPTLGRSELADVVVRNIQSKADTIHLELQPPSVVFAQNNQPDIDINVNPQEEKTLRVKILFSGSLRYNITLTASSLIDPNLSDSDTLSIVTVFAPDFPGLSPAAIVFLLVIAVLVYLKFVRVEK